MVAKAVCQAGVGAELLPPMDSGLTWKNVNLFDNEFHGDILIGTDVLKGNSDQFSSESINEVIASKLHELQKFDAYTEYKLIKLTDGIMIMAVIQNCLHHKAKNYVR